MKNCYNCNTLFKSIRGNHIYCSNECKEIKSKELKKEKYSKLSQTEKDIINKNQRDKRTKKIFLPIECRNCNNNFVPTRTTNIYCSIECSKFVNNKLRNNLRSRLNKAIKNEYRTSSAVNDLGCSIEEFKLYIESLFKSGMTWNNWSRTGWHIDHIIALAKFDLTNPEQLKKAVHHTNLQPMWAEDNWSKGIK